MGNDRCDLLVYTYPDGVLVGRSTLHRSKGCSAMGCVLTARGHLIVLFSNYSDFECGELGVYRVDGAQVGRHELAYRPMGCTLSPTDQLVVVGDDNCIHTYRDE